MIKKRLVYSIHQFWNKPLTVKHNLTKCRTYIKESQETKIFIYLNHSTRKISTNLFDLYKRNFSVLYGIIPKLMYV